MQFSLRIQTPTQITVFTMKSCCTCMINQCFFTYISMSKNFAGLSCGKPMYLHVLICDKMPVRAITPLKLHGKPRFFCTKSRTHEKMVINLQLQSDFCNCKKHCYQKPGLACRFTTHFDEISPNSKNNTGLSLIYMTVPRQS